MIDTYILVGQIAILIIGIGVVPRHLIESIAQHRPTRRIIHCRFGEVQLHVHIQPFSDVGFERSVTRYFLHTGRFQRSLLSEVVEGYVISYVLGTAVNRYVVVLDHTGLEELILPINVRQRIQFRVSSIKHSFGEE